MNCEKWSNIFCTLTIIGIVLSGVGFLISALMNSFLYLRSLAVVFCITGIVFDFKTWR